jgi:hypothetical protein
MLLSEIVREILNEITENTVLYHRSMDKHKVGDIINPTAKFGQVKNSTHWLANEYIEKKLEEAREKINPSAPSRFDCVYCSVVPNSAFSGKGYLYEVRPKGNFHVTLAYLINKMKSVFERHQTHGDFFPERKNYRSEAEYDQAWKDHKETQDQHAWYSAESALENIFEWYWKGINVNQGFKKNVKWIEVLCEQVQVVKVMGDESFKFLKADDHVETLVDIPFESYGYDASGNGKMTPEEFQKVIQDFNGKAKNDGDLSFTKTWELTLPKGTKCRVKGALVDQSKIKNFDIGDFQSEFSSPYRVLKLIPDGYNFYVDLQHFMFDANYNKKKKLKITDVLKRI